MMNSLTLMLWMSLLNQPLTWNLVLMTLPGFGWLIVMFQTQVCIFFLFYLFLIFLLGLLFLQSFTLKSIFHFIQHLNRASVNLDDTQGDLWRLQQQMVHETNKIDSKKTSQEEKLTSLSSAFHLFNRLIACSAFADMELISLKYSIMLRQLHLYSWISKEINSAIDSALAYSSSTTLDRLACEMLLIVDSPSSVIKRINSISFFPQLDPTDVVIQHVTISYRRYGAKDEQRRFQLDTYMRQALQAWLSVPFHRLDSERFIFLSTLFSVSFLYYLFIYLIPF